LRPEFFKLVLVFLPFLLADMKVITVPSGKRIVQEFREVYGIGENIGQSNYLNFLFE
jgi:hypothetical protein